MTSTSNKKTTKKIKKKLKLKPIARLFIIIIIIIFILIIFGTVGLITYLFNQEKVIFKNKCIYEINTKVKNNECIKEIKKGKIKKIEQIDTSKLGIKKINIEVINKYKKIHKYTYKIKIVDTTKPKLKVENKTIEIFKDESLDLEKNVTVTDNSKEEIKVKITGEYKTDTPGEYKVTYSATDKSKNKSTEEITIIVKEKKEEPKQENTNNRTFTTSKGFKGEVINGITYIGGYIIANKTYSVPSSYGPGLTKEFQTNFNIMKQAAANEGINLWVQSGFRSYNTQKNLYNRYVNQDGQQEADTYSARPGHSEHQTGTAADINVVGSAFDNTKEEIWLRNNAYKYGFIQRYPQGKTNETGYIYESWHYRYVGNDLAAKLYNGGNWITMESYFGITSVYQ